MNLTPAATILDTTYGFAIQGGVKVNLPMLAPGDAIFLQAAYAVGANSYTGWSSAAVGTLNPPSFDVIYDAAGNAKTSKSWSVTGGLLHYWTPTVRQGFAAYGALDQYGPFYDTRGGLAWHQRDLVAGVEEPRYRRRGGLRENDPDAAVPAAAVPRQFRGQLVRPHSLRARLLISPARVTRKPG